MAWALWFEYKYESFTPSLLWHAQIHPAQLSLPDCIWCMTLHGVQVVEGAGGISLATLWLSVLSALIQRLIFLTLYYSFPPPFPFPARHKGDRHFLSTKIQIVAAEQALSGLGIGDINFFYFLHFGWDKSNSELYTALKLRKLTWHLCSNPG